ncbi:uncharacterized protein LOC142171884 [Nicotiana tabacum]|uniref:Uncharacterized protein LOC142171884 n=1 Tax=Nicotiana tabacum TaxID=4097 RepID=A0AC58T381_TOBAC
MNGEIKVANKNIKRILQKTVDNNRQWNEKLPFTLLGYQTAMRTSTGAMPYMLVYGTEAVIPAEVEIPFLRVIHEAKLDDAEWIRVRQEQLMLIDEKIIDVVYHGQLYQNRMAISFNKRVKSLQFTPGKLVLKKLFPIKKKPKKSLHQNRKVLTWFTELFGGALILEEMDGRVNRSLSTQTQSKNIMPKDK